MTGDAEEDAVCKARPMGAHALVVDVSLSRCHRRLLHFATSSHPRAIAAANNIWVRFFIRSRKCEIRSAIGTLNALAIPSDLDKFFATIPRRSAKESTIGLGLGPG